MATSAGVFQYSPLLRDFWLLQGGIPARLWLDAGAAWKMLAKTANNDWTGDGEIQFPSQTTLPGAGSPDLATAWANSSPTGAEKWVVTDSEFWQVMMINRRLLELSDDEQRAYLKGRTNEMQGHMRRFNNLMSFYIWGNGGGAMAKLDGAMTVSGATTLVLKNKRCAKFFEPARLNAAGEYVGGDQLQFASDDGSGSSPAGVRPDVVVRVTGVNRTAGTLTITPALPATPVTNTDYVFLYGTYARMFKGKHAWCPLLTSSLTGTFFNVDRTSLPEKLGGYRYTYKKGSDPYKIVMGMLSLAVENGIQIKRVTVPPSVGLKIQESLKQAGITVNKKMSPNDAASLRIGVENISFTYLGLGEVTLVADLYYEQPGVDAEADGGLYFADNEEDEQLFTFKSGIGWKDYDGNGILRQMQGTQNLAAEFGMYGQYVRKNTQNQIVAGPTNVVTA